MALEGVFKKVKLDCRSMKDPSFQLALVLHNPQNANEVFLLSLRDCLSTLPAGHPVRRWYNRKSTIERNPVFQPILEMLQNELDQIWVSEEPITQKQREQLMRLLAVLDDYPPYLDLTILQAAGYQKLGNWARAEIHLKQWLGLSPLDRLEKTPARRDSLAQYMRENIDTFLESLVANGNDRFIIQIFLRAMSESISDGRVTDKIKKYVEADSEDVLKKLSLHYHRSQVPGFADWYLNRHLEGKRREKFLDDFFADPESRQKFWIFLSRTPDLPRHKEELAKLLLKAKKEHDPVFFIMAKDEALHAALTLLDPKSVKNLLKQRRQFFMSAFGANPSDMLSLSQLVEMGQVNGELVKDVVDR